MNHTRRQHARSRLNPSNWRISHARAAHVSALGMVFRTRRAYLTEGLVTRSVDSLSSMKVRVA